MPVTIDNSPVRQILAVSQSFQPYADRTCFTLPSLSKLNFTVKNKGKTGAIVEVNKPQITFGNCAQISAPQTQYQIQFKKLNTENIKIINAVNQTTYIENNILEKETKYINF